MATITATRPRVKPLRRIRLVIPPTATMAGIVQITVGKATVDYFAERLPSDFGTGFRLTRLLGEHVKYDILLDGQHSTCCCKGHLRHGRCKHVDGLAALRAAGKL